MCFSHHEESSSVSRTPLLRFVRKFLKDVQGTQRVSSKDSPGTLPLLCEFTVERYGVHREEAAEQRPDDKDEETDTGHERE